MAEATNETLARTVGAFAADAYQHGVPDEVLASVRQRVLDILGLCVAANRLPTSRSARDWIVSQAGRKESRGVGVETLLPAASAAFLNGVLAHSLDYDDTHLPSVLHPSATVVPAVLAAAQSSGATGAQAARAIAVGVEIAVRLGMAGYDRELGNSVFFEHGQHATSICGAMGGAVGAGLVLGLDAEGLVHSLGLAASMAAGIIEANRTGGTVKRLHCGWAAHSAVAAAQLVGHGFTGPPTVLEGRFGFFRAFLRDDARPESVLDGLGHTWEVPGIFFKPYPANHFTHTAIDAGAALRGRGLPIDRISALELRVPSAVVRTIGEPIEEKRAPATGYLAQFSGPYAVVAGLLGGSGLLVGLDDFTDELAHDPMRRALMAKVTVVPDERCDGIFPYQFPAILHARTDDGQVWTEEVLVNRGGPQRPLSDDEHSLKFETNVACWLSSSDAEAVRHHVLHLDELDGLDAVMDPLARVGELALDSSTPGSTHG